MVKHFRIASMMAVRLEEAGIPVAAVLRKAGLPGDLFQRTRVIVSTEELFALWGAVAVVSLDPCIGLRLGVETRIERLHPIGIAALSTENFGAAVANMAKYKRLCAPEEIVHEVEGEEWSVRFHWTLAVEAVPAVLMEHCFAWVHTIAQMGTGTKISPVRVEFVAPREHVSQLEQHFGCPIVCGATRNAIVFRREDAALPFVTKNAELLEMLLPQFDTDLKAQKDAEDGFVELVRGVIQQRLTGQRPSIEEVSRELHMSSRTLQRRLQESGMSFQKLLDLARRQMARHYLRNSVLELTETAYLLGYEDSNSFSRAFRGWEGMPPTAWREMNGCL
ncbi:MAG: AraC family transcriptional regulator [Acidobacteriaceae bacterium]|nr:AraC family transcriptional regulator [Acidobacteriaceae bacterium]